jgi:integrase
VFAWDTTVDRVRSALARSSVEVDFDGAYRGDPLPKRSPRLWSGMCGGAVARLAQWRETGVVFTTASGGFLEPRNINRMFHSLCARANVPQLRVHDLRHSCATLSFTMGVPPATVQRILRHSSISATTGTYVEVIEAVQRDAWTRWAPCSNRLATIRQAGCRQ